MIQKYLLLSLVAITFVILLLFAFDGRLGDHVSATKGSSPPEQCSSGTTSTSGVSHIYERCDVTPIMDMHR